MKPGVDGEEFIAIEVSENVGIFLVVYQLGRSEIFTNFNRYKYLAINTRLHFSDNS